MSEVAADFGACACTSLLHLRLHLHSQFQDGQGIFSVARACAVYDDAQKHCIAPLEEDTVRTVAVVQLAHADFHNSAMSTVHGDSRRIFTGHPTPVHSAL